MAKVGEMSPEMKREIKKTQQAIRRRQRAIWIDRLAGFGFDDEEANRMLDALEQLDAERRAARRPVPVEEEATDE